VVRIAQIESGSIAEELELEIGSRIIRINGQRVRDGIDLTFLLADGSLELETVSPDGEATVYEFDRDPGEAVGIIPAPDTIRECANKCVFCFIDGNPQGVRNSLWLRDDDFRLSFTYGSYVTLTNLGPKGMQRLVDQRISPLYVSVHATEPQVRIDLLKNDRAGLIMEQLEMLLEAGLEVHTQVVLCPEWNDGAHLDRTIDDLWSLGEGVRSLSIVPVGLTRYNLNKPVRQLMPAECDQAIAQVERARVRGLDERGFGWCYAADDMWLLAGRDVPGEDYFDDWLLLENGVGTVRRFLMDFDEGLPDVQRLDGRRVRLVTGGSMAEYFRERAPRIERQTGARVEVVEVENAFFGETVTAAGLLGGRDIQNALRAGSSGEVREGDVVLLPAEALNADDLFIDSLPLAEFEASMAPARVLSGYELTDTLNAI
jgi:putative radical SAM enzyme (TIGR03279 family)